MNRTPSLLVLLIAPFLAVPGLAQTTSIPAAGPDGLASAPVRFSPVWGVPTYLNEDFALRPRDFGQCEIDAERSIVYCGVKSGQVLALTSDGGDVLWTFRTKGSVQGKPLVTPDGLFVGSSDGCVYRLDPGNGRPLWKAPYCTDAPIHGDLAYQDGFLFFTVAINKLYVLKARDATFLYEHHRDRPQFMSSEGVSSPALAGPNVLVGYSDGFLVAIDRFHGTEVWTTDLSGKSRTSPDVDTTPVVDGGTIYASSFGAGPSAVRAKDGVVLWKGRHFGTSRPVLARDMLLVGTADGEVVAIDKTGKDVFVTKLQTAAAWSPVLVGDVLVVGGDRGLTSIDAASGTALERLLVPQGVTGGLSVSGRRIFFVGGGGTVIAVDLMPR